MTFSSAIINTTTTAEYRYARRRLDPTKNINEIHLVVFGKFAGCCHSSTRFRAFLQRSRNFQLLLTCLFHFAHQSQEVNIYILSIDLFNTLSREFYFFVGETARDVDICWARRSLASNVPLEIFGFASHCVWEWQINFQSEEKKTLIFFRCQINSFVDKSQIENEMKSSIWLFYWLCWREFDSNTKPLNRTDRSIARNRFGKTYLWSLITEIEPRAYAHDAHRHQVDYS